MYVNSELPWGLDSMPVSIIDDEIGIFDTADPRPHIPQEVHLTLPHLDSQEIHLHTIEKSQLSSDKTLVQTLSNPDAFTLTYLADPR